MKKFYIVCLVCLGLLLSACGDKKADIAQGGNSELIQPQQPQEGGDNFEEVIEEYEPPKPSLQANQFQVIYFAFDSFSISKEMFSKINQNAELLKENPNVTIVLEGNTDAYGSDEYNLALGNKRALAVKEALIVRGIKQDRIEVVSFGETKPVCVTNNSPECRQENRRVDFVLKETH
ncbi:OmpA family protein [Helicobacter kayseriensis]|uniref:OmpA family protein n=1 Tax=Helicobacter kayseriensis TaxID=2905877 RepID=UPI001E31A6F0|nr:OmpA family protein [Helicobacter kayseriensis]MCE3046882.1 OmpA family protein [Helicobacter kayseriensis]MCE3048458.1 OmpA family protein [Helicobacter kayseriensis]